MMKTSNAAVGNQDNDGVYNTYDLDDDNDGILDTNEGLTTCAATVTPNITAITEGTAIAANTVLTSNF